MRHQQGSLRGSGGLELFYQQWRPDGEARALLGLVHGLHDHSDRFLPVVEHLVARGYAAYALDLRGHGRSHGRRGHIDRWDQFREDVGALLQLAAADLPSIPVFLVGHSMGGAIALEYALRHPDGLSGVVAINPGLAFKLPAIKVALANLISGIWPTLALDPGLDMTALSRDPAVVKAHLDDPLRHKVGSARLGTEYFATVPWMMEHATDLKVPVSLFHGTADRIAFPEGSRAFFDRVTLADKVLHEYDGGFHVPHHDTNREQFLADLEGWLEAHKG